MNGMSLSEMEKLLTTLNYNYCIIDGDLLHFNRLNTINNDFITLGLADRHWSLYNLVVNSLPTIYYYPTPQVD